MAKKKLTKEQVVSKLKRLEAKLKSAIDEEDEKRAWDAGIDIVEALVSNSKNKVDDLILLPLLKAFRNRYDIPEYGS